MTRSQEEGPITAIQVSIVQATPNSTSELSNRHAGHPCGRCGNGIAILAPNGLASDAVKDGIEAGIQGVKTFQEFHCAALGMPP